MRPHLFTLCSAVSLLLCAAVCVLWARSYGGPAYGECDHLLVGERREPGICFGRDSVWPQVWQDRLDSARGRVAFRRYHLVGRDTGDAVAPPPPETAWSVPHWLILLPTLALPGRRVVRRSAPRRRPRWREAGLCPRCGYDLRATPDRCPECGTVRL